MTHQTTRSAAFDDALQNAGHALMLPDPVPALARVLAQFREEHRAEVLAEAAVVSAAVAPPTDATHGLSVQHADALWDAVAIPGPRTPTYPEQHERVCRTVREILDELLSARDEAAADQTALRDRIAAAICEFPFDDFGLDDVSYLLESTPDTQEWVPKLADAVLAVLPSSGCLTPEYTDGPCHCPACDPAAHRTDRSAVLADAVLAVLPEPTDKPADSRDRVAEAALAAVETALCDTLLPDAREEALAGIAAELPEVADRAAVRAQAFDEAADMLAKLDPVEAALAGEHAWKDAAGLVRHMARQARRMADETATETPDDTLPAWLYQRFMSDGIGWDQLDEDDRSYWEHQARAVRRAVARGGFKQPAAGARQDGTES